MILSKKNLKVVAVGDMAVDEFIRIKEAHEVCSIDKDKCLLCLSFANKIPYEFDELVPAVGNSANASVACAKLGMDSTLISNIGADRDGGLCIDALKKAKVSTKYVTQQKNVRTNYHYVLWYGPERTILIKHEDFTYSFPKIKDPDWMYLSSLGGSSLEYHHQISEYLKNHTSVRLAFQPGTFQMKLGTEVLKDIYLRTEIFICNVEEAELITKQNTKDLKVLSKALMDLGPKLVVITDGPKGSYTYDGNKLLFLDAYPQELAYERTGAGDSFASTFMTAIAYGKDIKTAMKWASINAMSVCKYVGAQKGLLTVSEIQNLLEKAPEDWQTKEV